MIRDREGIVLPYFDEAEDLIAVSYGLMNENSRDEEVLKEWNPM